MPLPIPENCATFSVKAFGKVEEFSPTLSRARVRIFYKGANRNSTYITEEFANKLLSTLSYTPVKGIYEEDDFTTHGEKGLKDVSMVLFQKTLMSLGRNI